MRQDLAYYVQGIGYAQYSACETCKQNVKGCVCKVPHFFPLLCLQSANTTACEGCSLHLDPYDHHRMTCAKTSSYQEAHTQLAAACAELVRRASAPYTDKNVTTERVGDALINLSGEA